MGRGLSPGIMNCLKLFNREAILLTIIASQLHYKLCLLEMPRFSENAFLQELFFFVQENELSFEIF
jgi:hypothetical protein